MSEPEIVSVDDFGGYFAECMLCGQLGTGPDFIKHLSFCKFYRADQEEISKNEGNLSTGETIAS